MEARPGIDYVKGRLDKQQGWGYQCKQQAPCHYALTETAAPNNIMDECLGTI
ncbi:hypothetical protein Cpin_7162 [Chitinophaga pinensis DSM 2588]|uniref:Uncharacterized protein n=1 Tax=Chitinophaga pinensis (strain ATCC 43595 / DSM 2588 / LMG 13176 / NBRC 15968 / NCIMB 11800 / UQM 2034) TaxID=485918 RepID=A0A979GXC6_CHIPD|nr:hypothetical protein Cpin_7162 [Chitinophaga pinensis DSM 2588]